MTAAALLADLRHRGVTLAVVDGALRYRPAAAVPDDLRASLATHKAELLQLLTEEQAERQAIRLAWLHPCEEQPWSPAYAARLVNAAVEEAAERHQPGGYDHAAFATFDVACAGAWQAQDLGALRAACATYLRALGLAP